MVDETEIELTAIRIATEVANGGGSEYEKLVLCFLHGAQWHDAVTAEMLTDTLGEVFTNARG